MRSNLTAIAAAAATITAMLAVPQAAQARFYTPGFVSQSLAEPVACRTVQTPGDASGRRIHSAQPDGM